MNVLCRPVLLIEGPKCLGGLLAATQCHGLLYGPAPALHPPVHTCLQTLVDGKAHILYLTEALVLLFFSFSFGRRYRVTEWLERWGHNPK